MNDDEKERRMDSQRSMFKGSPSYPYMNGAAMAADEISSQLELILDKFSSGNSRAKYAGMNKNVKSNKNCQVSSKNQLSRGSERIVTPGSTSPPNVGVLDKKKASAGESLMTIRMDGSPLDGRKGLNSWQCRVAGNIPVIRMGGTLLKYDDKHK
ncbi:hypothetical protein SK128_009182 [Halocaridina rubra]|uniref:Uncharacterized protein n=1 Tax=Halocaridina rubra TaxID=373956 RepID=A0AAN8W8V7_HALRR